MTRINTAPLSGMRDFLPIDVLRRNYVIDVIERVYQGYGFEPLETPTMERLTTLLGKYGEEGDQLIFRVLKRGEKLAEALEHDATENGVSDAGMRYDLTVPLARVVAEYRNGLPRVFKRYQIQPVYRADRPARGRYREFYQCDVDVVGSQSQTVEAEVLGAGAEVMLELGFGDAHPFTLRLNHRSILRGLMEVAGITPSLEDTTMVAIDKLDKIGLEGVRAELLERGIEETIAARLLQLLADAPDETKACLGWLSEALEDSEAGSQGVAEVKRVVAYCQHNAAAEHLRVDPYLARGLSYYTGSIFELEVAGFASSAAAGGRYDELIGMFSGQQIPACGFSLGLERIILLMDEWDMFPARLAGQPQVLVTIFDETTIDASLKLARQLRAVGLRVDLYPDNDRYGRQFRYADERKIRYALLLSPRELEEKVVALKDLETGDQTDVPVQEIVTRLQEMIGV